MPPPSTECSLADPYLAHWAIVLQLGPDCGRYRVYHLIVLLLQGVVYHVVYHILQGVVYHVVYHMLQGVVYHLVYHMLQGALL